MVRRIYPEQVVGSTQVSRRWMRWAWGKLASGKLERVTKKYMLYSSPFHTYMYTYKYHSKLFSEKKIILRRAKVICVVYISCIDAWNIIGNKKNRQFWFLTTVSSSGRVPRSDRAAAATWPLGHRSARPWHWVPKEVESWARVASILRGVSSHRCPNRCLGCDQWSV